MMLDGIVNSDMIASLSGRDTMGIRPACSLLESPVIEHGGSAMSTERHCMRALSSVDPECLSMQLGK